MKKISKTSKKTSTTSKERSRKVKRKTTKTTTGKKTTKGKKKTTSKKTTKKTTKKTKSRRGRISATPRGFTVVPGQVGARDLIQERLDDAKSSLGSIGIESRVYLHEYVNGEVDGEISVVVPRGRSALEVSQSMEKAFSTLPHGMGRFWFAPGVRLGFSKERDSERSGSARVRGMDDMQMHYRRMQTPKLIDSFLREQKIMIPGVEKKYKRKAEIVYIRINWNPDNKKPSR